MLGDGITILPSLAAHSMFCALTDMATNPCNIIAASVAPAIVLIRFPFDNLGVWVFILTSFWSSVVATVEVDTATILHSANALAIAYIGNGFHSYGFSMSRRQGLLRPYSPYSTRGVAHNERHTSWKNRAMTKKLIIGRPSTMSWVCGGWTVPCHTFCPRPKLPWCRRES